MDRAAGQTGNKPVPCFAGDQHVHTTYSIDAALLDGTTENVADYAAAADAGGLDWIITTDHSNVEFAALPTGVAVEIEAIFEAP